MVMETARNEADIQSWRAAWPNPAESPFNYHRFLREFESLQKRRPALDNVTIAIIGAGIAGLTAARELYRYGYRQIHIFEATSRIGGRLWSEPATPLTAFEFGAMRMPFFVAGKQGNSVLAYYASQFGLESAPFPNPGTCKSGVYIRGHLHVWDDPGALPDELRAIHGKWSAFRDRFKKAASEQYTKGAAEWLAFWKDVIRQYGNLTFRQLTRTP
jgi:tryptophan 2-monooxygenase